jgi:hypothetical protein
MHHVDSEAVDEEEGGSVIAAAAHLLQASHACHDCGCIVPVFALLIEGPFEVQGEPLVGPDDTSALLDYVTVLPGRLQQGLEELSAGTWHRDNSKTAGESYFMNHCPECGAKIGDWFTTQPGKAFFPLDDEGIGKIRGQRVAGPFTFDDPHLAVSSWTDTWLCGLDAS